MNIVLFSPSWPQHSDANGVVTYCAHMKAALEKQGHRVFIICGYMHGDGCEDAYQMSYQPSFLEETVGRIGERFFAGFKQYYYGAKAIVATLKKIESVCPIDLLEIEESFGWHRYIAKAVNFPVVMRFHGPHFLGCKVFGKAMDAYDFNRCRREEKAFKQAKYVNAPSRWVLDEVQKRYAPHWTLEAVFGNPIDLASGDDRWQISHCDQQHVLFVGRFDLLKGGDVIIEAFAKVLEAMPSAVLTFAGPDKGLLQEDGSLVHMPEMVKRCIPERHWSQIRCLGQVDKHTIARLRKQCHISITASRSEVFGYTVIESMATGVPVVAPRVAGVAELFKDGESGLYFEPGNAKDMSLRMIELMSGVIDSEHLGAQGYQRCADEFSLECVAQKALDYYGDVVADYRCS